MMVYISQSGPSADRIDLITAGVDRREAAAHAE
jgi:hypothetical protein